MLEIILTSNPVMESESPFTISINANVHGDPMDIKFIGDYARALNKQIMSLRIGDIAFITGKIRGGTILVERFTAMGEIKARNVNCYA